MKTKIELFVKDPSKSAIFYQNFFNFDRTKHEDSSDYVEMQTGNVRLALNSISSLSKDHFFRTEIENQRVGLGVEIVFEVDDIEAVYRKIESVYPVESALKLRSWGKKDFRIQDLDGYYIRVTTQ